MIEDRHELSAEDVRATALAIRGSVSTCERLIDALHPWTSYCIVPVFALANAGIPLGGDQLSAAPRVVIGVVLGLLVGKFAGITGFAWLATRTGAGRLPNGVRWTQLMAASVLAGIGFTVSLFITGLAFNDGERAGLADSAKIGILIASVSAAAVGALLFVIAGRRSSRDAAPGPVVATEP